MIISKREFLLSRAARPGDPGDLDPGRVAGFPGGQDEAAFSDADLARANLIRELQQDLGVNNEGVGVILHLLDQDAQPQEGTCWQVAV